uniref:Uncharacterized protein n=1 Tax=Oryza meridionalis TaxID=40149 RepID=A0A0E0EFZ7_9ORYZ
MLNNKRGPYGEYPQVQAEKARKRTLSDQFEAKLAKSMASQERKISRRKDPISGCLSSIMLRSAAIICMAFRTQQQPMHLIVERTGNLHQLLQLQHMVPKKVEEPRVAKML